MTQRRIAVVYVRVSTLAQSVEGVSLDAQRERAESWCRANDYAIHDHMFTDAGISGKRTSNRPALQHALSEACHEKGRVLIVYSLSRLARSTRDAINIAERLEKAGCDLVSLTEKIDTTTASGKMVFRMLAVLAEFERDLISERTTTALRHKAARGERVGQIRYGQRLDDTTARLTDDAAEQQTIGEITRLRASGASWRCIAVELNRRGITTKKGRAWSWHTARHVGLAHAAEQQRTAA